MAAIREAELMESVKVLSVEVSRVNFLRIPERKLMGGLNGVCKMASELVSELLPDSIIGHDFEGGHNGHDAASFVASRLAEKFATSFYVFPAYNGWPEERQWNQFGSSRKITDTLPLTFDLKNIQDKVITVHRSQKVFFDTIKGSSSYKLFSSREVLSLVVGSINYAEPPTVPLGYEYPNSKLRFNDFKKTVASIQ